MNSDEREIRRMVEDWCAATEAEDSEKVLTFIAEDALFLTSGNPPMTKADFADGQFPLKQMNMSIKSDIQEVRVLGDYAFTVSKLDVAVTPKTGGKTIRRIGNVLTVFEKREGRWLVLRDANMIAPVGAR